MGVAGPVRGDGRSKGSFVGGCHASVLVACSVGPFAYLRRCPASIGSDAGDVAPFVG